VIPRDALLASLLALGGCAPPLVWGDDRKVEERLLSIVPLGSSPAALDKEAERRGWGNSPDDRIFAAGSKTYFDDTHLVCRDKGGVRRVIVVAKYPTPFTTTVETMWLFDARGALRDICIRRTTDAL
jgi:hypothetical protein